MKIYIQLNWCYSLTLGLNKDIRRHARSLFNTLANHKIKHQATQKLLVNLVIADGHFKGIRVSMYGLQCSLYHQ